MPSVENKEFIDPTTRMKYIYVGETARPFRARVREHYKAIYNLKPESFMLQHWFEKHADNIETEPQFRFKIIRNCKDALTRQLSEAIWILEIGNLNSRSEFGANHLCRMISDTP